MHTTDNLQTSIQISLMSKICAQAAKQAIGDESIDTNDIEELIVLEVATKLKERTNA